ncbi:MAG: hypothetical protein WC716_02235 [Chitinophagaceae bacterium]|jgi:hypothetical protein
MLFNTENNQSRQYLGEVKVWQSVLEKYRCKNALLKERLSQSILTIDDLSLIEDAEQFQLTFINYEQIIDLLRHDMSLILKNTDKENDDNIADLQKIVYSIGKDISKMLVECDDMKKQVEQFISRTKYYGRLVV